LYIKSGAWSDQGKIRNSNEDQFVADPQKRIFLVADGMGGHAAGEVASKMAALKVEEILSRSESFSDPETFLQQAIQIANKQVYSAQLDNPHFRGMGSTLTVLKIQDNRYYIAHVGDSRAYLLRNGNLTQLTRDHSLVWQLYEDKLISKEDLSRHPRKNIVTRSIGTHPHVEAEIQSEQVSEKDMFLICSDGLTDVISDLQIKDFLNSGKTPQEISKILVDAANTGGGPDNITVVVVSITY
jgi:PPM family protein phosphatase